MKFKKKKDKRKKSNIKNNPRSKFFDLLYQVNLVHERYCILKWIFKVQGSTAKGSCLKD
jgi:hypothetical protein